MDITPSLHLWRFMMTGDNLNDYALEVFLGASVIPEPGTCPDTVRAAKLEAVSKVLQRISFYRSRGFLPHLIHCVFAKKMKMISEATTVKDLRAVSDVPKPHYNGNRVIPSDFSVPEEEIMIWSLTSELGPLNDAGFRRYMELFEELFGIDEETLVKEALSGSLGEEVTWCWTITARNSFSIFWYPTSPEFIWPRNVVTLTQAINTTGSMRNYIAVCYF